MRNIVSTCLIATILGAASLLGACGKSPDTAASAKEPAKEPAKEAAKEPGVTLTAEQIEKIGVATTPAAGAEYSAEVIGYGLILSHESIAQAVSELESAKATARFSQAALARAQHLQGTPGAMSADTEESLAQKAAVDGTALNLTTHRLSAQFGMNAPWSRGDDDQTLSHLASGQTKLLRATFPLGSIPEGVPHRLRAQRIAAVSTRNAPPKDWKVTTLWEAPADSSVPGRSFFALIASGEPQEGERLQVFAPAGSSMTGTAVPTAAVVMSDGKFWCYVEREPGSYARVEVDTGKLLADGYFVEEGVMPGDKLVTHGAAQMLAKETGGAEPDAQ